MLSMCLFLLFSFSEDMFSQDDSFCITESSGTNNLISLNDIECSIADIGASSGPYYFKIYVHVFNDSNGDGGQSLENVLEALSYLQEDFAPYNIHFVWDCVIIPFNDDDAFFDSEQSHFHIIHEDKTHQDGIDLFLLRDEDTAPFNGKGKAKGFGESALYLFGNDYFSPNNPLVRSHVLSHEVGHLLGLLHTDEGSCFSCSLPYTLIFATNFHELH